MADQESHDDNVIALRSRPARMRPEAAAGAGSFPLTSTNDRCIADGMRLVRSFMAIEDEQTRASIIRIVEEIAENTPVFRKSRRE
ncbi:MAG: hypothetical protein ACK4UO_12745 [Pseudolabrys sp.]